MAVSNKYQGGKDFVLQMGDGAVTEVFTTVAALRSSGFNFSAEKIDVTNHDSSQWSEGLDLSGIKKVSISGEGVFKDDATYHAAQDVAFAQELRNWRIIYNDQGHYYMGTFKLTSIDLSGEYKAEVKYSLKLESSGAITKVQA